MENLTVDESLRLAALQLAVDSLKHLPLSTGATVKGRAEAFLEFLAPKAKESNETS